LYGNSFFPTLGIRTPLLVWLIIADNGLGSLEVLSQ
jgi:hypothetical protein